MVLGWISSALVGAVLGGIITLLFIVKSLRKKINLQISSDRPFKFYDGNVKKVNAIIKSKQKEYVKANKGVIFRTVAGLKKKKRSKSLVFAYKGLINEVATVFNPESKNPMLEFSVKEAFEFANSVTVQVEKVLNAIDISLLKNCDISAVFGMAKLVVGVTGNKIVKTALGVSGKISRLLKILNPFSWLKRLIQTAFTTLLIREIIFASIEIIAWTFAEFYYHCNIKNQNQKELLEEVV